MSEYETRRTSSMPYQTWKPFPDEAIVKIVNVHGESKIGPVRSFWWGYETDFGITSDGVIVAARRLDKPKGSCHE